MMLDAMHRAMRRALRQASDVSMPRPDPARPDPNPTTLDPTVTDRKMSFLLETTIFSLRCRGRAREHAPAREPATADTARSLGSLAEGECPGRQLGGRPTGTIETVAPPQEGDA